MKKVLFLLGILLMFTGCSNNISPEDVSKISLGMSPEKVKTILGEPTKATTDRKELTTEYFTIATLYAVDIEFDENEEDKYRGYDEYSEVHQALDNKENVELFEYKTNEESRNIYIYFVNDEVSFFFDYNLSNE
ncbi:lipoprotein [Enterococcus sp. LJL90]